MTDANKRNKEEIVKADIQLMSGVAEDMLKWIFASMALVQSGILFSIGSSETFRQYMFKIPGILILIGLLATIFSALFIAMGYTRAARELANIIWRGELDSYQSYSELTGEIKSGYGLYNIGMLLFAISLLCLISGCVIIVVQEM